MKTLKASQFKATCLKVMDEVAATGEPVVVTKNGKPVCQCIPWRESVDSLFGRYANHITLHDDATAPLDESWDAVAETPSGYRAE